MRKFYYNFTRIPPRTIPLLMGTLLGPAIAPSQQPPLRTASLESHEGLTISATPWTEPSKYKEKFPKKSPYSAGVLAVQVSFRNDSDDSIKVDLSRIRLTVNIDAENKQERRQGSDQATKIAYTRHDTQKWEGQKLGRTTKRSSGRRRPDRRHRGAQHRAGPLVF